MARGCDSLANKTKGKTVRMRPPATAPWGPGGRVTIRCDAGKSHGQSAPAPPWLADKKSRGVHSRFCGGRELTGLSIPQPSPRYDLLVSSLLLSVALLSRLLSFPMSAYGICATNILGAGRAPVAPCQQPARRPEPAGLPAPRGGRAWPDAGPPAHSRGRCGRAVPAAAGRAAEPTWQERRRG